jgi:hypothetical protein
MMRYRYLRRYGDTPNEVSVQRAAHLQSFRPRSANEMRMMKIVDDRVLCILAACVL